MAGFFYIIYQDEGTAFALFVTLMEVIGIKGFYQDNVPLIKQYIYQTNRLIALYLPKLHNHFNETGISSMICASSWFLTSFCYVLQYSNNNTIPSFLLGVFDLYLSVSVEYKK